MAIYAIILAVVLTISPFALRLAEKQDHSTKTHLKNTFFTFLIAQIILTAINWRFLWPFLLISLIQITLLTRRPSPAVVYLNFANTFVLFIIMARLDHALSLPRNLAAIAATFLILTNNVIGLLLINKQKRLKPFSARPHPFLLIAALLTLITAAVIAFSQSKNTRAQAISAVASRPEVRQYLRDVRNGIIAIDHEDKQDNAFVIHVYEIKEGHTATFNWYTVDKNTGKVTPEF